MTKLPRLEAYALRRKFAGLDVPEGLPLSPVVQAIVNTPMTLDKGMLFLSALGDELTAQIMKIDPDSKPFGDGLPVFIHASQLRDLPPIEWLRKPILPKQGLTVIYGASGDGKSFYALGLALEVAQHSPVVYMVGEGQYGYPARVGAWCQHHKASEGGLYMHMESVSLSDETALETFIDTIAPTNPELVIVDTVARAMTGYDENSTRDMGLFIQACNRLMKRLECAVLLVHHTNKGGQEERGSGALRGAADAMIRIYKEDDVILAECAKTKDAEPFETEGYKLVSVEYQDKHGLLKSAVLLPADVVIATADSSLSVSQRKILDLLAMPMNQDGLERDEIRTQTNLAHGTLSRALNSLMQRGFIAQDEPRKPYQITDEGLKRSTASTASTASTKP